MLDFTVTCILMINKQENTKLNQALTNRQNDHKITVSSPTLIFDKTLISTNCHRGNFLFTVVSKWR